MKKIISLFQRNYDGDRLVRDEVVPGAEWVQSGEGVATQKWDGTCCMVRGGRLFKRYDVKKGRTAPAGFEPAQDPDATTGHWPGWLPVGDGPEDAHHREAFTGTEPDGTYELLGPKVQSNPGGLDRHMLIPHGKHPVDAPRTFAALREWFTTAGIEGVVWWHADGRMVKIKAKDFGIHRIANSVIYDTSGKCTKPTSENNASAHPRAVASRGEADCSALCRQCAAEQGRFSEWDAFHYGTNRRCDACDRKGLCAMMPNRI